jgi:hypothetical protein
MDLLPNGQTQVPHFTLNPGKNQTMKSSIISNWRPLLRALYAFLITIAAVWVMPRNVDAQLYIDQINQKTDIGLLSKYNATTGAVIKADFITGLDFPQDSRYWATLSSW